MSWNYDPSLPSGTDKIRFLVQDTDEQDQLVQDEEIAIALTVNANSLGRTGAQVARAIALKLGRRPSARLGQIGLDADEQYRHYMELAEKLESSSSLSFGGGAVAIFAGGISVSDKQSRADDAGRTKEQFTTKVHQSV